MAIFSAIGAAIASAIGLTGTFLTIGTVGLSVGGALVAGVVAGGLGMATAKILGVNKAPGVQQSKDPGVKVQLPPATDNRLPVFYGRNITGAIAVDAEIKNQNNTMVYVFVIGEKTTTGNYSINHIYRGDSKLNFTGASVNSITDPNATSTTNIAGKIRCRVYAGNAQDSANQIFPTGGVKVAAQTLSTKIDATTSYEDLVYAIVEIDFDRENGLTDSGSITFDITNDLQEPSAVLLDYCTNSRYGAGLSASDLDTASFTDLATYSNELVAYTTSIGTGDTHKRWQINGMLSTYQPVKDNIDQLCQNCSTFFTYDPKQGKFKVVPNRPATTAEKADAFLFNDDNIISSINTTETELYSMYNQIEAEYAENDRKDQTTIAVIDTPAGDRNTNEPDNPLQVRYNMVNDFPRTYNLANIDLKQSRTSKVLEFDASYSAIQVDVGDIVKVTNSRYGFNEKLFRMMRSVEQEGSDGMLSVNTILLEYADSVYEHSNVAMKGENILSGIPGWYTGIWGNVDYGNIANIAGNIVIVDDPVGGSNANIVDPGTGSVIGNVDYANIDFSGIGGEGGFGGTIPFINFPITIPDIPGISHIDAIVNPIGSTVSSNVANSVPGNRTPIRPGIRNGRGRSSFDPGEIVNVALPMPVLPPQDASAPTGPLLPDLLANIDFSMFGMGMSTIKATAPNIALAPRGALGRGNLGDVQAGLQIEDDQANINSASSATVQDSDTANVDLGTPNSLITAIDVAETGGIDEGIYSSSNSLVPYGVFDPTGSRLGFRPVRTINYDQVNIAADGTFTKTGTSITDTAQGSGIITTTTSPIPSLEDNFEFEVSRSRASVVAASLGLPAANTTIAYLPANINVINYANTNLGQDPTYDVYRGFDVTNSDKRISKSDQYREPRYGGCFIAGSMVLMADGAWKEIEFIVIGEKVMGLNGVINTVTKLHHYPVAQQLIYTIDNAISLTDTHPMLTSEGWKSFNPELTAEIHPDLELAGKLMIADILITHTGPVHLYDYTKKVQDIPVYNLDVDGDDTFIVDGYVVHNK
jgi:hypothetical protein